MREVGRRGYALTMGYFLPGRTGIAAPVCPVSGLASFAVGVAGPADIIEAKHDLIQEELQGFRMAALEIEQSDVAPRAE